MIGGSAEPMSIVIPCHMFVEEPLDNAYQLKNHKQPPLICEYLELLELDCFIHISCC